MGSIGVRPGGRVISSDFERLSTVVDEFVEAFATLRRENAVMRRDLAERDARIRGLDGKILELNQLRQDLAKRLDDLIARVELLDSKLQSTGP